MSLTSSWQALVACATLSLCACATTRQEAPPGAASAEHHAEPTLSEPIALSLLDELLLEQRELPVSGWRVWLPEQEELDVDVRIGQSAFGIEWVSAEDRARYGALLPEPDPSGQLRLVRGSAASRPAFILLLDERSYRVASGRAQSPAERARELEDRMRRDVRDFLDYVRVQDASGSEPHS